MKTHEILGERYMRIFKLITLLLLMFSMVACNSKETFTYQLEVEETYEINEELDIERVDDGVMNVSHRFPWDANSLIIEMKSDIVLIDTPYTYDATKELFEWIKDRAGDKKITAINTGFHFDNLGGNKYLKEQGVKIYGISNTVDLIHEKGEEARQLFLEWLNSPKDKKYYEVYKDLGYVEPTEILDIDIDEEIKLNFGDESLTIYYPGETHSPDNLVVYYPGKEVLFGGCMIKEMKATNLGNVADANLEEWPNSIERLMQKYNETNVSYVVPGHGEVGNIQLLHKTLELLK